jgi:hypothetical protein
MYYWRATRVGRARPLADRSTVARAMERGQVTPDPLLLTGNQFRWRIDPIWAILGSAMVGLMGQLAQSSG